VLLTDPATIATVPGVTPAILEAAAVGTRWAHAYSLKYVCYASIAFGVCSVIACSFLGNISKHMTNWIAANIGHSHGH
jgi:hypothetical protein